MAKSNFTPNKRGSQSAGTFRIIAGQWRGRKLSFAELPGLRPTMDRIRETLFNWLTGEVHGARCLDLCAGSGALGLEALSRGAEAVDFVDNQRSTTSNIEDNLQLLRATGSTAHCSDAISYLATCKRRYDLVFLDPPFNQNLAEPLLTTLAQSACLAPGALIYLETEKSLPFDFLPANWELLRDKSTSQIAYRLLSAD